jgi:hypothetical protein
MQIIAIERFTKEEYQKDSENYLKENQYLIQKFYQDGKVRSVWSRDDKAGTVLMIEADSMDNAKKLLLELPLVQKKITTFSFLPLKPYHLEPIKNEYFTLVYVSAEATPLKQEDIYEILKKSRQNNAKLDITGILLYQHGSFFQVLEGKKEDVLHLYDKISEDERHNRIAKVATYITEEKTFSEWSMGYADISGEEIEKIDGLNDYFSNGNCFLDLQENQVKNLLAAFREGKWRQKIN